MVNATDLNVFSTDFLPTIKNLVEDFIKSNQNSRDPEVLLLFATIFSKLGSSLDAFFN